MKFGSFNILRCSYGVRLIRQRLHDRHPLRCPDHGEALREAEGEGLHEVVGDLDLLAVLQVAVLHAAHAIIFQVRLGAVGDGPERDFRGERPIKPEGRREALLLLVRVAGVLSTADRHDDAVNRAGAGRCRDVGVQHHDGV